jgi:UDP-N-acetylmuramoylalanine--D-glutamate ligase
VNLPDDILIVGLGMTGVATARFLAKMEKKITIVDEKPESELASSLKALEGIQYTGSFGSHRRDDFLAHPLIVVSPGVDSELPLLKEAREKGIRVIGEMELAYSFIEEPIIAITGTNGKTTVTTLVGEIFRKAFGKVFVGGNIGDPLINYVLKESKATFVIIEVSSFQLETIDAFKPKTSVVLNVTEDHLDRYRSFAEYRDAKYRIFENQDEDCFAIFNASQPVLENCKAKRLFFSSEKEVSEGAFLKGGAMSVRFGGQEYSYERTMSPLVGIHNTENLLVAILVAHVHGIGENVIQEAIGDFKGLPHRIEAVRKVDNILFYNDSKATNVDSTKRALESVDNNVVLIAGGKDKGGSYKVIADQMSKVRALILIGEAKEKINKELGPYADTYLEDDLAGAVQRAFQVAKDGDVVLFSPMCSSFDMFRDYKDRGNQFKTMVESL